jgi:hypothetical protein
MMPRIKSSITVGGKSSCNSDSAISVALPSRENTAPK